MNKLVLREIADKYYNQLNDMLNDLAYKCTGGEEMTMAFPSGKIIIKLK
jgi:hypothetical protein